MTSGKGPGRRAEDSEPIAIVGMAGIYPKAPDVVQFWKNILDGVDAVTDAPEDWCGDLFLDPESDANDRIYTKKGGFLGDLAVFDPLKHGVMPSSIDGGEPDQFLALEVAASAVEDAEFDQRPVPGDRVAVILGRGTYINRGFTTVVQHGIMVDRMLAVLKHLHPDTSDDELATVKAALKESLPPFNAQMAPALVPNLVTGRIANRLDFRGTNYIVDAACASSLIALERGIADLRAGRCDMAVVGGVHASTPPPIYMIFSQLEALSRKGRIRPFSAEADGTLLAEGVGLLCIKRLSDAEAAGDRIYALVRSVGVASDGRGAGILAPRLEGELLALRRAYEEAGIDTGTVGLVEAHGTATTVGDATEVEALGTMFGDRAGGPPSCALGSVKSMIGHCLPAAGSAGLIKTALALHHKVLPPTLVDTPNPELGIDDTPLYLNTEARPWVHGRPTPRRAGVNAFGFGGINAHAILEEYRGGDVPQPVMTRATESLLLDAANPESLRDRISETREALAAGDRSFAEIACEVSCALGEGSWRAAVVATDAVDAAEKLARIDAQIGKGKKRLRDRRGLYLSSDPLAAEGKVAFLFPGEGSQHMGMLRELMLHFPVMRPWFDLVDGAFLGAGREMLPSQAVFPADPQASDDSLSRMDLGPEAIFAANQAMLALYGQLGLRPDMLVGHSTGEYSALFAAGSTSRDDPSLLQSEMRALNDTYKKLEAEGAVSEGVLVALGAVDGDGLSAALKTRDDVWLAMDNCPNQKVLATTTTDGAAWAKSLAGSLGGIADVLPIPRAYHCPAFADFTEGLKSFLDGLEVSPAALPTYSCLSAAPFPDDPSRIRELAAAQWSGPVRFVETIEAMYDAGARVFVECGPRNNLISFVDDILRRKPHLSVAADTAARSGLEQLQHMMASLAVEGVSFDVAQLFATVQPGRSGRAAPLKMGIQPMSVEKLPRGASRPMPSVLKAEATPAPGQAKTPAELRSPEPQPPEQTMLDSYFRTMERFVEVENEILEAYLSGNAPAPLSAPAPRSSGTSASRFPLLGRITRAPDGNGLSAEVVVSAELWPYLDDHGFGQGVSLSDPGLRGLRVVPLTFSIEVLAEAAAALDPSLVVTALNEVRASRWLALDRPERRYEVSAERVAGAGDTTRVRVRLRDKDGPALRPILVEAEVELAPKSPAPPPARTMDFGQPHEANWSLADVYSRIMFHGPRLQAVKTVDRFGATGSSGNLIGLKSDALVAGVSAPQFETDAVTLDAVGQLVGVWAAEMLPESFHIFPFRAERIDIFRAPLAAGEVARCNCEIALLPNEEMRSDIEVVSADGHLQCRVTGWWDKRFDLPDRFFRARLDPGRETVSRSVAPWTDDWPGLSVTLLDDVSDALLTGSGGIWAGVLAGLALSAQERREWDSLRANASQGRQMDWLRGRVAAKDAVRLWAGLPMRAADVRVQRDDENGPPSVMSDLQAQHAHTPVISISHASQMAAAAAADPADYAGVGVDLQAVEPRSDAFLATAFQPAERDTITQLGKGIDRDLLATRFWCAKEAAAKSCGVGLDQMLSRFSVSLSDDGLTQINVTDNETAMTLKTAFCDQIRAGVVMAVVLRVA